MGLTHQTLPTPHPRYRSLAVSVPESIFAARGNVIPEKGTKYKDFAAGLMSRDYVKNFGEYLYTGQDSNGESGSAILLFAPDLSEEEQNQPFSVTTRFGDHYWPPILKALRFLKDRSFPRTTRGPTGNLIFADRYFVREVFIPSVSEGTLFTTRHYMYNHEVQIPQHDTPTPTSVSWDFLGCSGSFRECLHPKIAIPGTTTAVGAFSVGEQADVSAYGGLDGQVFPATNFTEWGDYIVSDKLEYVNGVYHRVQIEVTPPPEPEIIIR